MTILACDIGGTHLRVALCDLSGNILLKRSVRSDDDDPGALPRYMREVIDNADVSVSGAVVGLPGSINYQTGQVIHLPHLPHWPHTVSADWLSAQVGLEVLIANGADLAALGEHRFGAGIGTSDMVYITASTGVGAGVIIGNKLLHGKLSLAEAGHTIIDFIGMRTFEELGSGTALQRLAGDPGPHVTARAREGDTEAIRQIHEVAYALGVGALNLAHIFSPELIVIGGGLSMASEILLEPIRQVLREEGGSFPASQVRVAKAMSGDDAGLKGAVAYWIDQCNLGEQQVNLA